MKKLPLRVIILAGGRDAISADGRSMMLEWLGETKAAALVRSAVERALAARHLTPDVGGKLTTAQITDAIVQHVAG